MCHSFSHFEKTKKFYVQAMWVFLKSLPIDSKHPLKSICSLE